MGLRKYVVRRTVYTLALLVMIVAFNFVLFQIVPFLVSCPGENYTHCAETLYVPHVPPHGISANATAYYKHLAAVVMKEYGFDQPLYVRFILYFRNMFTLQFGYNVGNGQGGLVVDTISERAPFTLLLLGASTVASFIIGIGLGVIAAARRGRILDVSSLSVLLFINALPVFFLGVVLELLQVSSTGIAYVPVGSLTLLKTGYAYYAGILQAFFLPFLTLTLAGVGGVFLTQRATMIDTMGEDYILMARAKGLPERTVLYKHAFRNAILPIATAFAISIGFILSGAIITETVFGWPGLGSAIYEGITVWNYPLEQAMFFVITVMVLIAVFAADVVYGFLDPRVSTG